jgi:hypothetical protein
LATIDPAQYGPYKITAHSKILYSQVRQDLSISLNLPAYTT